MIPEIQANTSVEIYVGKKPVADRRPITRAEVEQIRIRGAKLRTVAIALLALLFPIALLIIEAVLARGAVPAFVVSLILVLLLGGPIWLFRISLLALRTNESDEVILLGFGDSLITGDPRTAEIISSSGLQFKRDGSYLRSFNLRSVSHIARMPEEHKARIEDAVAQGLPIEPRELSPEERDEATRFRSSLVFLSIFLGGGVIIDSPGWAALAVLLGLAMLGVIYAAFRAMLERRGKQRLRVETDVTYKHKTYRWGEFLGSESRPWTVEGEPADWRLDPWSD